jgi:hypothetical protein
MKRRISWKSTLYRFLFWTLIACLTIGKHNIDLVIPVVSLFLVGEICCLYLRSSIRRDLRSASGSASIKSHMVPMVFLGVVIPVVYTLLTLHLRSIGFPIDLGTALVTELFSPFFILPIKAPLVFVVFISEWTWASLITRALESKVHLRKSNEIVDPSRSKREVLGVIERLVTLMMVTLGGHIGAGIVIGIKSTTRLPKLVDRQDAEQFVVETLSSIGLATLGGLLISL